MTCIIIFTYNYVADSIEQAEHEILGNMKYDYLKVHQMTDSSEN